MSPVHALNLKIVRRRSLHLPKAHEELATLPEHFSMINGEMFNVLNKNVNGKRLLIFMKPSAEEILKESTEWHSDGTFSTSTNLFYQVKRYFIEYLCCQVRFSFFSVSK